MKVIRETCVAGKTIDRSIIVSSGEHSRKRSERKNPTKESVMKNNDRMAAKILTRILNANFSFGDLHITLTYKEAPSAEQAKKDRKTFIRKLRKAMKAEAKELKYVAVTEYENKRIHHHIVINSFDVRKIAEIWDKGFVMPTVLDDTGNYQALAEYLIKETSKTFRLEGSMYKRRWISSQNLIHPAVKREEVDASELFKDPEPIKGYYIPKDSIRRFEHPVTGLEHLEYMMVAIDEPRKYKAWPRGKAVRDKEHFRYERYEEEQEELCLDFT